MSGNLAVMAAAIGAGICVLGAGLGIGRLSAAAMDGTARQPSSADSLRTKMLLSASYIEGAALFGLLINMMIAISE